MTRAKKRGERLQIFFTVPGRPIPLERVRVEKKTLPTGKVITRARTPDKSVVYRQIVQLHMNMGRARVRTWPSLTKAPLSLSLWIYWADGNHGDGSNLVKAIEDAGNGLLWHDDKQIAEGHFYGTIDREKPRVEVLVQIIEGTCSDCRSWQFVGKPCPKHDVRREVVG